LEFGTLVLSEKASIYSDYKRTYCNLYLLRLAKFIFQRPDTKQMILEVDGNLIQDKPENVYVYNQANVELFKKKIQNLMELQIEKINDEVRERLDKLEHAQARVAEIQRQIDLLHERNQQEPTVGRQKQIQGLTKHQRRLQRRANALEKALSTHKERIAKIRKDMELSLSMVDSYIKMQNQNRS
jgi:hydroxymethylglutaryl-CoA reductase